LLGSNDPYLGLQDRDTILYNKARQKQIWQAVSNPGAVLWQGKKTGMWKSKKRGKPSALRKSLVDFFMFEAGFSLVR